MSDGTCTDFTLKFFSPLVYILIPEIVYIQYSGKQQFSIQKRVQRTETCMQIHSVTQTRLNSSFTHAFLQLNKCFHSVPSFVMIVLGPAKQVSTWKLSFMLKVDMPQWNNWIQVNIWKFIYLNCGEWNENMIDHRSYTLNLSSWEIKAWKKKIQAWTGFEPMTSAIPVQCSTNWAIKPTGSWPFCEFVIYP